MGDFAPIRENRFSRDELLCQSGVPEGGRSLRFLMAPVITSDLDLAKETQYIEMQTVREFRKNRNVRITPYSRPYKIGGKSVNVRLDLLQCLEKRENERGCLQEIGGKLGFDYVVFGKLEREDSLFSLGLKILVTRSGEIQSSRLVKMPQNAPSMMREILPVQSCQLMKSLLRFPDPQNGTPVNHVATAVNPAVHGMTLVEPAELKPSVPVAASPNVTEPNATAVAPADDKGSDAVVAEKVFWPQWIAIGGGFASGLALVSGALFHSKSSDIAEQRHDLMKQLLEGGSIRRDAEGNYRFASDEDAERYRERLQTLKRDGIDASDTAVLYFTLSTIAFAASAALLVAQWKGDPIFGSDDIQPEVFPEDSKLNFRIQF